MAEKKWVTGVITLLGDPNDLHFLSGWNQASERTIHLHDFGFKMSIFHVTYLPGNYHIPPWEKEQHLPQCRLGWDMFFRSQEGDSSEILEHFLRVSTGESWRILL